MKPAYVYLMAARLVCEDFRLSDVIDALSLSWLDPQLLAVLKAAADQLDPDNDDHFPQHARVRAAIDELWLEIQLNQPS